MAAPADLTADASAMRLLRETLGLFFPILMASLGWLGMRFTDTALIGHTGTVALAASAMGDFWMGVSSQFVRSPVTTSLFAQAYGAKNYHLMQTWLQVAVTILLRFMVGVWLLWATTQIWLEDVFGTVSDHKTAVMAGIYANVLATCLPARVVQSNALQYLQAMKITSPAKNTTAMALLLNLAFGLQFVLGIGPLGKAFAFGFFACPAVTSLTEWFLAVWTVGYYMLFKQLHAEAYPPETAWGSSGESGAGVGWILAAYCPFLLKGADSKHYREEVAPRIPEYLWLYLPSVLSISSDFWRMFAIGVVASKIGTVEVAVFNSSYRLAWLNMAMVTAFSSSCNVLLGQAMGAGDGALARRVVKFGCQACTVYLVVTTSLTVCFIRATSRIFSDDPAVEEMFYECRWELGAMVFCMVLAILLESLLVGLKMTGNVLRASLIGSWGGQVPATVFCVWMSWSLKSVYLGVAIGYVLCIVLYAWPLIRVDFDKEAAEAHQANQVVIGGASREPLLKEKDVE